MLKKIEDVIKDISSGKNLLLAGDEDVLAKLPAGSWIGGTIPYFMDESGGTVSREMVFASEIPENVKEISIKDYSALNLDKIPADAYENGFTVLVIPATSQAHIQYAQNAPNYEDIFLKPVIGWISGVHLSDLGKISPKVFNGKTGSRTDSSAVAMHCRLDSSYMPQIGIVNLFEQGKGDSLKFTEEGFLIKEVSVNGKTENFAQYIRDKQIDTKLPLVADYCGAMVNVSFQEIRDSEVALYAPVFKDVEYRIAKPVNDYVTDFKTALPKGITAVFSCNCILNFLYSELEGKTTQGMYGPITFGEIAYQLLNQTLVYLEIKKT